jgi:hypothetical protein
VIVTLPPPALTPEPGERGRTTDDLAGLLRGTIEAWDDLMAAIADVDLGAVGRKDGRTAARTLVVLGSWTEGRPLPRMRANALAGSLTAEPLDAIEERVIAAHLHDGRTQILGALERARADVVAWAASPDVAREALLPVGGPLGVVPLGTLVGASAYQCAVAARDLQPAGVIASDRLLAHGVTALLDTVGAVAAQQSGEICLTAITPQVRAGTGAVGQDWRTRTTMNAVGTADGPSLACDAGLLIDIASGRASAPAAYARGDLRATDLTGLLAVAQVLSRAPGLPGTEGLRTALQAYESSAAAARAVGDAIGSAFKRLRRT